MGKRAQFARLPGEGWIGGVRAGLADFLGWTSLRLRVTYVLALVLSADFSGAVVYLFPWSLVSAKDSSDPLRDSLAQHRSESRCCSLMADIHSRGR